MYWREHQAPKSTKLNYCFHSSSQKGCPTSNKQPLQFHYFALVQNVLGKVHNFWFVQMILDRTKIEFLLLNFANWPMAKKFWSCPKNFGPTQIDEYAEWFNMGLLDAWCSLLPLLNFRKLIEIFPDAKVVMTVRDNPEKWYDSVHGTIYQINLAVNSFPLNILTKLDGSAAFHDMAGNLMKDGVPDGNLLYMKFIFL